jgi:hypothetical protein
MWALCQEGPTVAEMANKMMTDFKRRVQAGGLTAKMLLKICLFGVS